MRALSASNLLEIWELGRGRQPIERALVILGSALPRFSTAELRQLTIGQRDACLLHLHELTFGPHLIGVVDCPTCHDRLELTFESGDLFGHSAPLPDPETIEPIHAETSFRAAGYELTFRLPTTADLIPLSATKNTALASRQLIEACLVMVQKDGAVTDVNSLPDEAINALIEKMSQTDPLADLALDVTCPACEHRWQVTFDIVSYFWGKIEAWTARLLHEVHVLASAYGWREADILAMSASRRERYLELVGT